MDNRGELIIIDLDSKDENKSYKNVDDVGCYNGLIFVDGCVFCADMDLYIVDIESASEPRIIKKFDTESTSGIAYKDGTIFLFDKKKGIRILNADPPEEASIGQSISPDVVSSIRFKDEMGVAINEGNSVKFMDFSNPSNPKTINSFTSPNSFSRVALNGDCAYLAGVAMSFYVEPFAGIQTIDLRTPINPKMTSSLELTGGVNDLVVDGNYMFTSSNSKGIHVIDISDRFHPKYVKTCLFPDPIISISYANGYIYAVSPTGYDDKPGKLRVIDATEPENSAIIKVLPLIKSEYYRQRNFCILDKYAFVPLKNGLQVIDISSPADAHTIGFYDLPIINDKDRYSAEIITAYDNHIFITAEKPAERSDDGSEKEKSTILVINPFPIEKIKVVNSIDIDDSPGTVRVIGGHLFYDGAEKMTVFDYKGPTEISKIGSFNIGNRICSYDTDGEFMYVIQTDYGMRIYNLWNE